MLRSVFGLAVFVRIYWFFVGNQYARLREFIPLSRQRLSNLWDSVLFFCFIRRRSERYAGHDAFAGATYAFFFLLYLRADCQRPCPLHGHARLSFAVSSLRLLGAVVRRSAGGTADPPYLHVGGTDFRPSSTSIRCFFGRSSSTAGEVDSIFSGYKFLPQGKAGTLREQRTRATGRRKEALAFSSWDWATCCSATTGSAPPRSPASSATTAPRRTCASRTAARSDSRFWV